jgi:hypothetical protein
MCGDFGEWINAVIRARIDEDTKALLERAARVEGPIAVGMDAAAPDTHCGGNLGAAPARRRQLSYMIDQLSRGEGVPLRINSGGLESSARLNLTLSSSHHSTAWSETAIVRNNPINSQTPSHIIAHLANSGSLLQHSWDA